MEAKKINASLRLLYTGPLLEVIIDAARQFDELAAEVVEERRRLRVRLEAQREYENWRCPCGCGSTEYCDAEVERIRIREIQNDLPF